MRTVKSTWSTTSSSFGFLWLLLARDRERGKLQALVYDILPSTTAVFSYAVGSRKPSANEQFLVGAQTVISLLQTTQMISDACFITDRVSGQLCGDKRVPLQWRN